MSKRLFLFCKAQDRVCAALSFRQLSVHINSSQNRLFLDTDKTHFIKIQNLTKIKLMDYTNQNELCSLWSEGKPTNYA